MGVPLVQETMRPLTRFYAAHEEPMEIGSMEKDKGKQAKGTFLTFITLLHFL